MKLTLTPTDAVEKIDGVPCRRWEGTDEHGTPVHAWVRMVSPRTHDEVRLAAFDLALQRLPEPSVQTAVFDYRFIC